MPAESEPQRRFMAMVYAYKQGRRKHASAKVKKAAKSMTANQAHEFMRRYK